MVKYRTLDGTFGALADPTRRAIVLRLLDGECPVGELAKPHRMSLPAISKHISVLEDAGLVLKRKEGRQQYCRLATNPMLEIDVWLRRFRDGPELATKPDKEERR
jgi:DNA-binding transcriptional ArsR family regulator